MIRYSVCLSLMVALFVELCAFAQYIGPIVPGTAVKGTANNGTVRKATTSTGTVRKATTSTGSVRKGTSDSGQIRKSTTATDNRRKATTSAGSSRKSVTSKNSTRQQTTTADRQNAQQNENELKKDKDGKEATQTDSQKAAAKERQNSRETSTWGPNSDYHPDVRNWPLRKRRMRKVVTGMSFDTGGVTVLPNPDSGASSQRGEDGLLDGVLPSGSNEKTATYVKIQGFFDGKGMFVFDGREVSYVSLAGSLPYGVMVNDEYWYDLAVPMKMNRNYSARNYCRVTKAMGRGTVQTLKNEHTYAVSVDDSSFEGAQQYNLVVRFE